MHLLRVLERDADCAQGRTGSARAYEDRSEGTRTLVMELGPRILLQRRLILSEVVLEDVEEALVGGLGHPAVPHDERTVLDKGLCGLWTGRGSAGLLGSRGVCSCRAVALLLQRSDAQVVPRVHHSSLVRAHAARARAAGAKSRCRWGGGDEAVKGERHTP